MNKIPKKLHVCLCISLAFPDKIPGIPYRKEPQILSIIN